MPGHDPILSDPLDALKRALSGDLLDALKRAVEAKAEGLTVAQVFDKYLAWCMAHRAPGTFAKSAKHCPAFLASLPPGLLAAVLRPYHVVEWIEAHPTWGANQRRAVISAITRPINWAAELGYPGVQAIRVSRPAAQRRHSKFTAEIFAKLLGLYPAADTFRDLLVFSWEVGCRPVEARLVERRHVRFELHRVEIAPEEKANKTKRCFRMLYLSPAAEEIAMRLALKYPEGALFRNEDGNGWTVDAVDNRFQRCAKRIGLKVCAYDFRHAFATRMLKVHDPITVAALMGHKNARMLMEHYEELTHDDEHLAKAVRPPAPQRDAGQAPG